MLYTTDIQRLTKILVEDIYPIASLREPYEVCSCFSHHSKELAEVHRIYEIARLLKDFSHILL